MADSPLAVHVHLIWSTNYVDGLLRRGHHAMLTTTFAAICRTQGATLLSNGGGADHVHLLIEIGRRTTVSSLVRELKLASADRLRGPLGLPAFFQWQSGYAAFAVAEAALEGVKRRIETQDAHHESESYEGELRSLFASCGTEGREVRLFESRDDALASGSRSPGADGDRLQNQL